MVKKVEVNIYHHKSKEARPKSQNRTGKTERCPYCYGTGKVRNPNSIYDMPCSVCKGKGRNSV